MSNYHVMELSVQQHEAFLAFHITVPDTTNFVGINHRIALKAFLERDALDGVIVSRCPATESVELAQMVAGEIYEHVEWLGFDGNLNNAQKVNAISTRYTALAANIVSKLTKRLEFWGYAP